METAPQWSRITCYAFLVIFLTSFIRIASGAAGGCSGYTPYGNYCFKKINGGVNVTQAIAKCNADNSGFLPAITSKATWTAYQSYRTSQSLSNAKTWLGLMYLATGNIWTDGTAQDTTKQPNDTWPTGTASAGYQYVFSETSNYEWKWANETIAANLICQQKASVQKNTVNLTISPASPRVNEDVTITVDPEFMGNYPTPNFTWTLTGATPATASGQSVTVTYTTPGSYNISVKIDNSVPSSDTKTVSIFVLPPPCPTNWTGSGVYCFTNFGNQTAFKSTAASMCANAGGTLPVIKSAADWTAYKAYVSGAALSRTWLSLDRSTGTPLWADGSTISFKPNNGEIEDKNEGSYKCARADQDSWAWRSCSDSNRTFSIVCMSLAPVAIDASTIDITFTPSKPETQNVVLFTVADGFQGDGTGVTFVWDFDDGTPSVTTTSYSIGHAYQTNGFRTVTLTTSNSFSSDQTTVNISVANGKWACEGAPAWYRYDAWCFLPQGNIQIPDGTCCGKSRSTAQAFCANQTGYEPSYLPIAESTSRYIAIQQFRSDMFWNGTEMWLGHQWTSSSLKWANGSSFSALSTLTHTVGSDYLYADIDDNSFAWVYDNGSSIFKAACMKNAVPMIQGPINFNLSDSTAYAKKVIWATVNAQYYGNHTSTKYTWYWGDSQSDTTKVSTKTHWYNTTGSKSVYVNIENVVSSTNQSLGSISITTDPYTCPNGWWQKSDTCVLSKGYSSTPPDTNPCGSAAARLARFADGRTYCNGLASYVKMISFHNIFEYKTFDSYLDDMSIDGTGSDDCAFWIGYSNTSGSTPKWEDGSSELTNPDPILNLAGCDDSTCNAVAVQQANRIWRWDDASESKRIICEQPAPADYVGYPPIWWSTLTAVSPVPSNPTAAQNDCWGAGWFRIGTSCYLANTNKGAVTFGTARAFCEQFLSRLPSFHSLAEYQAFMTFKMSIETNSIWLGADDIDSDGTYVWHDLSMWDYDLWTTSPLPGLCGSINVNGTNTTLTAISCTMQRYVWCQRRYDPIEQQPFFLDLIHPAAMSSQTDSFKYSMGDTTITTSESNLTYSYAAAASYVASVKMTNNAITSTLTMPIHIEPNYYYCSILWTKRGRYCFQEQTSSPYNFLMALADCSSNSNPALTQRLPTIHSFNDLNIIDYFRAKDKGWSSLWIGKNSAGNGDWADGSTYDYDFQSRTVADDSLSSCMYAKESLGLFMYTGNCLTSRYSACQQYAIPDISQIPMEIRVDYLAVNTHDVVMFNFHMEAGSDYMWNTYTWQWDDGTPNTVISPSSSLPFKAQRHYFKQPGTYDVTMTVTNSRYTRTIQKRITVANDTGYTCPTGWHKLSGRCYAPINTNLASYTTPNTGCCKSTFDSNKDKCTQLYSYANMVSIHSKLDENGFIYFKDSIMGWTTSAGVGAWIGLNKQNSENTEIYTDGTPKDYTPNHLSIDTDIYWKTNTSKDCVFVPNKYYNEWRGVSYEMWDWQYEYCSSGSYYGSCSMVKIPILVQGNITITPSTATPDKGQVINITLNNFFGLTHPGESYYWDFGDGWAFGTGNDVTTVYHSWSIAGTYTINVTVTNPVSIAWAKKTITVKETLFGCAPGWVKKNDWCFMPAKVSNLTGYTKPDSGCCQDDWNDNEDWCNDLYETTHLPIIHDAEDLAMVQSMRYDMGLSGQETWLGLNKISGGGFIWPNGTDDDYYPTGSPPAGGGGDCVYLDKAGDDSWTRATCSSTKASLCMMPASIKIYDNSMNITRDQAVGTTGKPVRFTINKFVGYDATCVYRWDWGDGTPISTTSKLAGFELSHTFANPGSYLVKVNVSNAWTWGVVTTWIDVEDVCEWQAILVPIATILTNPTNVTWWLKKGTQCNLTLEYDDGGISSNPPILTNIRANATFYRIQSYVYPVTGLYTVKGYAVNRVSDDTITNTTWVQTVISNVTWSTPPNPHVFNYYAHPDNITMQFKMGNGSACSFTCLLYSGSTVIANIIPVQYNYTTNTGQVTVTKTHYQAPGDYEVRIMAINLVTQTNQSDYAKIQVQYRFDGFIKSYKSLPGPWLNVSQAYPISWSFNQSSHYACYIRWGNTANTYSGINSLTTNDSTQGSAIMATRQYNHSHFHQYDSPGNKTVTVNCSNRIDSYTWTQTFIVQYPILDIKYETTSPGLIGSGTSDVSGLEFRLYRSGNPAPGQHLPTDAQYNYTFGDQGGTLTFQDVPEDETKYKYKDYHNYDVFGPYYTTLRMTNLVSSVFLDLWIIVVQKFENVRFTMIKNAPYVGVEIDECFIASGEVATFKTTLGWGSDYNLTWTFKDNRTPYPQIYSLNGTLHTYNYSYANPGNYSAVAYLKNAAMDFTAPLNCSSGGSKVVVQDTVNGFSLNLEKQEPALSLGFTDYKFLIPYNSNPTLEYVDIVLELYVDWNVNRPGSDVYVTIDWGDATGNTSQWFGNDNQYRNSSANNIAKNVNGTKYFVYSWIHRCKISDDFMLKVQVTNRVSRQVFFIPYTVYNQVRKDTIGFHMSYVDDNNNIAFAKYDDVPNRIIWLPGIEYTIKFAADMLFGTYEYYNWTFSDGWTPGCFNDTIYRQFTNDGWYRVSLDVINVLSTDHYDYMVVIERRALNVSWADSSPWPRLGTGYNDHGYQINTGYIGTDACYAVDHYDTATQADCRYKLYGNYTTCQQFHQNKINYCISKGFPQNKYWYAVSSESLELMQNNGNDPNITAWHKFYTLGRHNQTLNVINHVSNYTFFMYSYVTMGPCAFPVLEVKSLNRCPDTDRCKCYKHYNNEYQCPSTQSELDLGVRRVFIRDKILIDATIKINCTSSPFTWYNWTAFQISGNNYEIPNSEALTDATYRLAEMDPPVNFQSYTSKILVIGERQLLPNHYRFVLTVTMSAEPAISRSDYAEIDISQSPLQTGFAGGFRAITVQSGANVLLDAWSATFDPDMGNNTDKTGITWRFYCKRGCEGWPAPTAKQEYPDWNLYTNNCPDTPKGCFGNGPQELTTAGVLANGYVLTKDINDKASGNVTINTAKMVAGRWYTMMVVAAKDGSPPRYATQQLLMYISPSSEKPLGATIRCVTNCNTGTIKMTNTKSDVTYQKVNPTSRFSLEAIIDDFDPKSQYYYNWTLLDRPSQDPSFVDFDMNALDQVPDDEWLPNATTGGDIRTMSIASNTWGDADQNRGLFFRLIICKQTGTGTSATQSACNQAFYEFFINKPPSFATGSCTQQTVNNAMPISLGPNKIKILCSGFTSDAGHDLYFYIKQKSDPDGFYQDVGRSKYTIIANTADGMFEILPTQGQPQYNYKVWYQARVMDSFGAFKSYYSEATVYPVTLNDGPGAAKFAIMSYAKNYQPGEDYFQLVLKEQQTTQMAADQRRFSAMLNYDPPTSCGWDPCSAPSTRLDVMRGTVMIYDENMTAIPATTLVPPTAFTVVEQDLMKDWLPEPWRAKYLGTDYLTWPKCEVEQALHTLIRERATSLCQEIQIPYFSVFVQIISAFFPVTNVPAENSLQIMHDVEACMVRGLETLEGKDAEMGIQLEADILEEAITSVIAVVANMEETTNFFGWRWRCELTKYYPQFTMDGLMDWIRANTSVDPTAGYTTSIDIWERANISADPLTELWLDEVRGNITDMHLTLDRIKVLKAEIADQIQSRKVMGEADSTLVTPNITAVFVKAPTSKATGQRLAAACGCYFNGGDSAEMFGPSDKQEESVMAAVECAKNNPFTSDKTANNITGNVVNLEFKNSSGPLSVKELSKPIEAFMNRDTTKVGKTPEPIYNYTRSFKDPMLLHVFIVPKYYGVTLRITENKDPFDATTTPEITTTTSDGQTTIAATTTTGDVNITVPGETKFAVFVKYWKSFNGMGNDYHGAIALPHWEEDENFTCSTAGQGDRHTVTFSWANAIASANDTAGQAATATEVKVYVGIRLIPEGKTLADFQKSTKISSFDDASFKPVNYTIESSMADCKYFDTDKKIWSHEGTAVGPLTTLETTHCLVSHLTSFSSGFEVPMNSLDLENSGFTNLADNPVAFVFCLCCFALYFILLVWCRRKDKEDKLKGGIAPLPDNDPRDRYLYELTFYTGQRKNAGTTARVYFVLTGTDDETDVRHAADLRRPCFKQNGVDSFIMAVPRQLGKMTHLRIWHDNSGQSPSWYFSRMQIMDVQNGEQFFFVHERWLAVEEDDGQVERIISVAGKNDLVQFNELFWQKSKKNLFDGHIWFSVFRRPVRSTFTRVQRLTCCLCLIYCTMVANIMFYGTGAKQKAEPPLVSIGPISITLTSLVTGMISSAIVIPINVIIVMIFRHSKPKPPPSPQQQYEMQMKEFQKQCKKDEKAAAKLAYIEKRHAEREAKRAAKLAKKGKLAPIVDDAARLEAGEMQPDTDRIDDFAKPLPPIAPTREPVMPPEAPKTIIINPRKKKAKCMLPWWFIYIGYGLAFCTVGVGFWLIVEFAGVFGKAKAIQWVISMFLSLIQSILFVQPIKIILLAIVYSVFIKKPEKDEDEPDEIMLREDEVYLHDNLTEKELADNPERKRELKKKLRELRRAVPPNMQFVKDAREQKLKELAMWKLIKEIAFYVIFLYTLMMVAYGTRDERSWFMTQHGLDTFGADDFNKIHTYDDFFQWLRNHLVPNLYPNAYANGDPTPTTNYKFTMDEMGYLVGTARLRQLRNKNGDTCKVQKTMAQLIKHCRSSYSFGREEEGTWKAGWKPLNPMNTSDKGDPAFTYQTALNLRMQPYAGQRETYWGGGFAADLGATNATATQMVNTLYDGAWLDINTRAVFVEFAIFYPAPNMFLISQFLTEWIVTGGAVSTARFEVFRLDPYVGPNAIAVMAAEMCAIIFLAYFLYREGKTLYNTKPRKNYFMDFWNIMECCIILLSIVSIAMYACRYMIRQNTLSYYNSHTTEFNNFAYSLFWDQLYGYFIYAMLFIANIKFLRLLRFNQRISMLANTLKYGWKYIMSFMSVFSLVFLCFCMGAALIFQQNLADFSNFTSTMEALLVIMLNKFTWDDLKDGNSFLGPAYFFVFSIVINFILVNMLLSVINDTFAVVKHHEGKKENEAELITFIWCKIKKFLGIASAETGAGEAGRDYVEEKDEMARSMDEVNDRIDDMMDRLDDFIKAERRGIEADAEAMGIDLDVDADGCIKKKTYITY